MAKITHGGPSFNEHELSDPDPHPVIRRFQIGDDALSPGDNSLQSSSNMSKSNDGETADPPLPAQTTESHSEKLPEAEISSIVHSTDGDGQEMEVPPYGDWTVAELREECMRRSLPHSGNKSELIDRLEQDDLAQETENEEF